MINPDSIEFTKPLIGIDPLTKGSFTIHRAWLLNAYLYDGGGIYGTSLYDAYGNENEEEKVLRAEGRLEIHAENNPLYSLIKESPLRLQKLLGSVDFGHEKRFIQLDVIKNYRTYDKDFDELGGDDCITFTAVFNIIDNLGYLEAIEDYRNQNLL